MTDGAVSPTASTTLLPWPLYCAEKTSLHEFRDLPSWKQPDTSAVVEKTFTAQDKDLVDQLRAAALAHLKEHGLTTSDELKSPIKGVHWRDIYHPHRHRTAVVPTPDPRQSPGYTPPLPRTDWPDWYLHQLLVARKRNVAKAKRMLLDCEHWWCTFGMDDLRAQPECPFGDKVATFFPERVHGLDRHGQPLIIGAAGRISLKAYHAAALPLEAAYIVQAYKREIQRAACQDASARAGRRITTMATVTDLHGFTIAHRIGIPWVRNQAFIDSNFYPETVGQVLVINAPGFFSWIFSILKAFIDAPTQEKISILSSHFHATVMQRIGPHWMPKEWGGACDRCGGLCLPVNLQVDDAEERRRQAEVVRQIEADKAVDTVRREVTLPARGQHEVRYTITAPSTTLGANADTGHICDVYTVWWSYAITAKDVDFSLLFHPPDASAPMELVPVHRVTAGDAQQTVDGDGVVRGCYVLTVGGAEDAGEVQLVWSNSFSIWSSKHITLSCGLKKQ